MHKMIYYLNFVCRKKAASESITAVAVEEGMVYYTYKDKVSSQHMLKKWSANKNGTLHDCIDKNGYYYVVEHSPKHQVIKFDSDWKPLRKSDKDAIGLLFNPHDIYMDEDN